MRQTWCTYRLWRKTSRMKKAVNDHAPSVYQEASHPSARELQKTSSELVLDRLGREGLHNRLRRLRLHKHLLPENHLFACLRGRLLAGLDHHQAWHYELAVLLALRRSNARQGAQCQAGHLLLHLATLCDGRREGTLGHAH